MNKSKEIIPCYSCKKLKNCIVKINKLKLKMYGIDPKYISDDEPDQFHTDMMHILTSECKKLRVYFPYKVVSRDGLMVHPNFPMETDLIEEEEWNLKNLDLYEFYREYHPKII